MSWREAVAAQQGAEAPPQAPGPQQGAAPAQGWRARVAEMQAGATTGGAQGQAAQSAGLNPVQRAQQMTQGASLGSYETPTGRAQGFALPPDVRNAEDTPARTIMQASLADDPQTQIEVYAARRFPGDPNAARERYGVIDGEIVFQADDGKLYREAGGFGNAVLESIGGGGLPALGGMAGAALGGPAGAALGGGFGESVRKMLANLMLGEKQSPMGNALDIGTEALLAGAGQKIGESVFGGAINRSTARDFSRYNPAAAMALRRKAMAEGIPLTAAEESGLPSLLSTQAVLSKTHGPAGDVMGEFSRNRARQQIPAAIERRIGPAGAPPEVVGGRLKGAAEGALQAARDARSAKSGPEYRKAFQSGAQADPSPVVAMLDDALRVAKGSKSTGPLREVRKALMTTDEAGEEVLDTSIEGLHNAKIAIDDLLEARAGAENAVGATARHRLGEAKKLLLETLDDASPEYRSARIIHAKNSPVVDELKNSVVGTLSRISDNATHRATAKLFDPAVSPAQIAYAKRALSAQDPKLWDEALNLYLRNAWTKASRDGATGQSGNVGGQFRKLVFGNDTQRRALKEALGPERYAGFSRLMDVLDATTRAQGGQSWTHFAAMGQKGMEDEAASIVSKAGPIKLTDWWVRMRTGRWQERMADALTSGKGLEELRQLRKLSPRSEKALGVATQFLINSGAATAADFVAPTPSRAPGQ